MLQIRLCALLLLVLTQIPSPMVAEIHMLDTEHGWAIGGPVDLDQSILRSEDGGETWTNVTPPDASWTPFTEAIAAFLDDSYAWVIYGNEPTLWTTDDGGSTWSQAALPELYAPVASINLLNKQQGWLLLLDCCAAGHEGAYLYATTDAAKSWQLINEDGYWMPSHDNVPHDLGSFYHSGMTFADANVGWLTTASFATDKGAVLQTLDGGASWHYLTLPAPEATGAVEDERSTTDLRCGFFQPMTFSETSVTIIAKCLLNDPDPGFEGMAGTYLYHTDDAGDTWEIQAIPSSMVMPQNTYSIPAFTLEMINAQEGWLLSQQQLYRTRDGGQTWTGIAEMGDIIQLDFVDENTGWLLTDDYKLMQTHDGGISWVAFVQTGSL